MDETTAVTARDRRPARRLVPLLALAAGLAQVAVPATGALAAARSSKTDAVVKAVKNARYGEILVNARGFTLYTYSKDKRDHSTCAGGCLSAWPALTVPRGRTPVGKGVSDLGFFTRSNGQRQVTYKGRPLYLFEADAKSGRVTGQGVAGFSIVKLGGSAAPKRTTTTTSGGGYGY